MVCVGTRTRMPTPNRSGRVWTGRAAGPLRAHPQVADRQRRLVALLFGDDDGGIGVDRDPAWWPADAGSSRVELKPPPAQAAAQRQPQIPPLARDVRQRRQIRRLRERAVDIDAGARFDVAQLGRIDSCRRRLGPRGNGAVAPDGHPIPGVARRVLVVGLPGLGSAAAARAPRHRRRQKPQQQQGGARQAASAGIRLHPAQREPDRRGACQTRAPKMAVPTRTMVAPSAIAST